MSAATSSLSWGLPLSLRPGVFSSSRRMWTSSASRSDRTDLDRPRLPSAPPSASHRARSLLARCAVGHRQFPTAPHRDRGTRRLRQNAIAEPADAASRASALPDSGCGRMLSPSIALPGSTRLRIVDPLAIGSGIGQLDRIEIARDAFTRFLVGGADQPHHQKERHHCRHEIGIGDLPDTVLFLDVEVVSTSNDDQLGFVRIGHLRREPRISIGRPRASFGFRARSDPR